MINIALLIFSGNRGSYPRALEACHGGLDARFFIGSPRSLDHGLNQRREKASEHKILLIEKVPLKQCYSYRVPVRIYCCQGEINREQGLLKKKNSSS
jgi:hypothetical protein